jgi:synaptobrevin homolog YKT6
VIIIIPENTMVQLFSIIIYRWRERQTPIQLAAAYYLQNFNAFTRGSAKEILQFVSAQVVSHSKPGDRHGVIHKEHFCHVIIKQDQLAIAICTDKDYPQQVVNSLMLKCLDIFLNSHGDKWQTITSDTDLPTIQLAEADPLLRINRDLKDTRDILIKSIDQLLEREEKLTDVLDKAERLSFQSRLFMQTADDRCCRLL